MTAQRHGAIRFASRGSGAWVGHLLVACIVATALGCAGAAQGAPAQASATADVGCLADAMPTSLDATQTWTPEHTACREDPVACTPRCEQGDATACYAIGVGLQQLGRGAEGEQMFARACRGGSAIGCTNYGAGLLGEAADGMDAPAVCAARIFERTCAAGERLWGCGMWGMVLANGEGVSADPARALEVLERACALTEHFACDVLGSAHRRGVFGEPSAAAAREAYARGCRGGYTQSCEALEALGAP